MKKIRNSTFNREKMLAIFGWNFEIEERCKGVHCVDLGESFPTSIYLMKSASIQPRTSPSKFGGKFNSLFIHLLAGWPVKKDLDAERMVGSRPRHITLSEARSRLYRRRFWPPNNHFAAFFKIYKICTLLHRSELKFLEKIIQIFLNFWFLSDLFFAKLWKFS